MLIAEVKSRLNQLEASIGLGKADKSGGPRDPIETVESDRFEAKIGLVEQSLSQLSALISRADDLLTMVSVTVKRAQSVARATTRKAVTTAKAWLTTIKSWISRISGQLWNLVAGLVTPKEWSIGGEIGTSVLGLANVKLEIRFGA